MKEVRCTLTEHQQERQQSELAVAKIQPLHDIMSQLGFRLQPEEQ